MSDPFATYPVVDEPAAVPVHDPIGLERYQFLRFLSQGGMGEVWLVEDQRLHCQVAMKVVGQAVRNSSAAILRFQEEAQITAQLSHPAIIPIHDLGTLADGRAYYTMPVVGGPRLADAMEAWHRGGDHSGWTLHRLVDSFRTVCEAIAYAHTRSVIHRDLKPGNVMVGSHGEVLVLDWGLAKIWTRQEERGWEEEEAPITSDRASIPAFQTRAGSVFGTMAYMAPEQALGEGHRAGPPADVYALGVMLWEMLLGAVPPRVELEPLPENPAGPHAVPELLELARRALQRAPESRISAADFAGALQSYLEGAERRDRAMKLVMHARRLQREEATLRRDADAHRQQAEALLARTRPLDPIEKKRPAWEKQDLATRSSREADLAHLEVQRLLGAALLQAPDLVEAHDDLAELYHQEHVQAEAAGDHATALRAERLLAGHDRGRFRAYLAGNGAVTLHTEPSGARVNLYRYVEQDRHLVPVFARDLGPPPPEGGGAADGKLVAAHPGARAGNSRVSCLCSTLGALGRLPPPLHYPLSDLPPFSGGTGPQRLLRPSRMVSCGWGSRGNLFLAGPPLLAGGLCDAALSGEPRRLAGLAEQPLAAGGGDPSAAPCAAGPFDPTGGRKGGLWKNRDGFPVGSGRRRRGLEPGLSGLPGRPPRRLCLRSRPEPPKRTPVAPAPGSGVGEGGARRGRAALSLGKHPGSHLQPLAGQRQRGARPGTPARAPDGHQPLRGATPRGEHALLVRRPRHSRTLSRGATSAAFFRARRLVLESRRNLDRPPPRRKGRTPPW